MQVRGWIDPDPRPFNLGVFPPIAYPMTTLIVQLEAHTYHVALDSVKESLKDKNIVLRASSDQPNLGEGELTDVLFDLDEAALSVTGEGQTLVDQGVAQGLNFTLVADGGHSVEIDSEQFR